MSLTMVRDSRKSLDRKKRKLGHLDKAEGHPVSALCSEMDSTLSLAKAAFPGFLGRTALASHGASVLTNLFLEKPGEALAENLRLLHARSPSEGYRADSGGISSEEPVF